MKPFHRYRIALRTQDRSPLQSLCSVLHQAGLGGLAALLLAAPTAIAEAPPGESPFADESPATTLDQGTVLPANAVAQMHRINLRGHDIPPRRRGSPCPL
jgi:hypothetical protein